MDERGFSSFQYLISGDDGGILDRGDHFITNGEDRKDDLSIAADLGIQPDLSGKQFAFSLQHNFIGGRNFTFTVDEVGNGTASTLCWGMGCDADADIVAETLGGDRPFTDFNGLQLQVRANEDNSIINPLAAVQITRLSGVDLASGTTFFDDVVTPSSLPTILFANPGRQVQWLMADDNDLTLNEWELTRMVTLSRDDLATEDVTALRIKVDLVRDPNRPFGALVPIPGGVWLFGTGLMALLGFGRCRRASKTRRVYMNL